MCNSLPATPEMQINLCPHETESLRVFYHHMNRQTSISMLLPVLNTQMLNERKAAGALHSDVTATRRFDWEFDPLRPVSNVSFTGILQRAIKEQMH